MEIVYNKIIYLTYSGIVVNYHKTEDKGKPIERWGAKQEV